jgi:hypothetical protein
MVWTGSELAVAWIDETNPFTAPDLVIRTFDEALRPTSDEITLASSAAREGDVALTAAGGAWAAAWRENDALTGTESIIVKRGLISWQIGPFQAGAATDRPALAVVDGSRLLLAFTEGTNPSGGFSFDTPRLRIAVLDTQSPGPVEACEVSPLVVPYSDDPALSQQQPNVAASGGRFYIAWRSERAGDLLGDELWLKEVLVDSAASSSCGLDLSIPEFALPRDAAHQSGDQRSPALASTPLPPEGAIATAWEDLARTISSASGAPDVVVELIPTPVVRYPDAPLEGE